MSENAEEMRLDLLIKQATYGLTDAELQQLDELGAAPDDSFERAAAAIHLAGVERTEAMPEALRSMILARAAEFFDREQVSEKSDADGKVGYVFPAPVPRRSFRDWFGWAVAAAACFALMINIWLTRFQPITNDLGGVRPTPSPQQQLNPAEERQQLMSSGGQLVKASWSSGNVREIYSVSGDIVWSDAKQAGYMRFTGLPVNDRSKTTYQLWIFDETQDPKTPIDGGTFDISQDGEVIIPINAKLNAKNPKMFAVTIEKPGGVVVSDRKRIAAIGKIET